MKMRPFFSRASRFQTPVWKSRCPRNSISLAIFENKSFLPASYAFLPVGLLAQVKLPENWRPNASPYDIPFLPLWAVIVLSVLATLAIVGLVWWLRRRWKKAAAPPTPPRQMALDSLQNLQPQIESEAPGDFTVEVASVLRRFVVGQYGIPATRQTSQEFLQSLTQSAAFSEEDQALLKSFLEKSDLIEFAKFQATQVDNRELWEKARQFVVGRPTPPIPGGSPP
jgi:hypothetical protein